MALVNEDKVKAMTREDLDDYLRALTDAEVLGKLQGAADDMHHAAQSGPDSDWHVSCFAATLLYAQEANRRGISIKRHNVGGEAHAPEQD
jgi:hypothetical protein